jgi:hypothetical protein
MLACTSIGPGFLLAVIAVPIVIITIIVLAVCAIVMGVIESMSKKKNSLNVEVK